MPEMKKTLGVLFAVLLLLSVTATEASAHTDDPWWKVVLKNCWSSDPSVCPVSFGGGGGGCGLVVFRMQKW